jgi:hypothetical protein
MFSATLLTSFATDPWAALDAALAHVAEDSFFAIAEPAPAGWRALVDPGASWMEARLAFRGAATGVLLCRLPRALAQDLTAAFLGVQGEHLDDPAVSDMTGELANMVGGCWLTHAFPSALVDLGRARVTDTAALPDDGWHVVLLNGVPFGVTVSTGE